MRIRSAPGRPHRGAVLVIVLILLGLLAMLAISLATTSVLDRSVSRNYIDEVRARLVAKAGVEHAVSRIHSMIKRGHFDDPALIYWGSNTSEIGDPDKDTPLGKALNPSFAIEDEAVQNPDDDTKTPLKLKLDDRDVGISGTMSTSAYGVHSDVYRLRVSDANSRININDGIEDSAVTKNLTRILNHLGAACKVQEAGTRIMKSRPMMGYRTRHELKDVLGARDYEKLAHHISLYAWADKNVVNPVPLSQAVLGAYPIDYNEKISMYRYGRSRSSEGVKIMTPLAFAPDYAAADGFVNAIMGLDEVNAQWISRSTRSPVNVNVASVEVLTALIADLRGIFMVERRKKNPGGGQYTFMFYLKAQNVPGSEPIGSEVGFLYATPAFRGPADKGTGTANSISASTIAEEMVACRSRKKSPAGPIDYGVAWYGGPFRTWRQFNAFCDALVAQGIIADDRPIYFDYVPSDGGGGGPYGFDHDSGSSQLVASPSQPKVAAQAIADVLKANFNPNCTLNELNPDLNLFLEVDKTDLICNSTEFCFTPMGYFEIESEGLITKTPQQSDLLTSRQGIIQARETIECVVRMYDVYRETTQADFSRGNLGLNVRRRTTNSNKPLELGPEPQAGENPGECRWSGWIQASTIGGIRRSEVDSAVETTPKMKDPEWDASALAHFQFDHRLNFHAGDQHHPLQFSGNWGNKPDHSEDHAGPYNPSRGSRGQYRLARDWSQDDPPAAPVYTAPSDLRIDGVYIERDNGMLYPCTTAVFATVGSVAFWLKPAFRPEMTGKVRTFFSTDTFSEQGGSLHQGWQLINAMWFFPAHDNVAYKSSANEGSYPQYYVGPWHPVSLVGGYATKGLYGGGVGHQTPSLNHGTHAHGGGPDQDEMRHHEWVQLGYCWDMSNANVSLLVNGKVLTGNPPAVHVHPQPTSAADWTSENAIFRLGEPSTTMQFSWGGQVRSRNWTIDGTLDEFYMWKGNALSVATQIYDQGRYWTLRPGNEGIYTSQPLLKDERYGLKLADASRVRPPPRPHKKGSRTSSVEEAKREPDTLRPICAFWTLYPPEIDAEGKPVIRDHLNDSRLPIEVKLEMLIDGQEAGNLLTDEGGSPIENVNLKKGQSLQYRLKMQLPDGLGGSILLSTPMIDDVTIFFSSGTEYIHYNRTETEQ